MASRPPFCFMISPDGKLLLEEIARRLAASGQSWRRVVFWGDVAPGPDFWDSLRQQGLFAENRAVIVRNAQEWPAPVWKGIDKALGSAFEGIWPFFCLEVEKVKIPAHIQKSKCLGYAQRHGCVWNRAALAGNDLGKYAESQAKSKGLDFAPGALHIFCQSVIPEAAAIGNELEKFSLLAKDGKINCNMAQVDHGVSEADAFSFIRRLESGDLQSSWREAWGTGGSNILFLLTALLAREFRLLWQLANGENPPLRPDEISHKRSLARKIGKTALAEGFCALADAEWQVKSGRQTPDQALEWLIVKTLAIFNGNGNAVRGDSVSG